MNRYYDLVVAGSGPAGLASAIHAARAGLSVLVLDPHEQPIDKACGEGIMPGGVDALARMGVVPIGRPFVGIQWSDGLDPKLHARGHFPHAAGLGVRRTVLSSALMGRAARLGVRLKSGRVGAFEQRGDEVELEDGTRTRWLIGADGLRSHVRRALGLEEPPRRPARLGLRRHYAMTAWSAHVEVFFADGAEAYVTPVADDLVGVAILFDQASAGAGTVAERFDALLARFPLLAARLAGQEAATPVRGAGPFEQQVSRRVVGNVLLVGDAAGYVDPLTGEGVALGLATAEAAIDALRAGSPLAYEASYRAITSRYFALTSLYLAFARHRALQRPLIRIARTLPFAFDAALAELAYLDRARGHQPPPCAALLPEAPYV